MKYLPLILIGFFFIGCQEDQSQDFSLDDLQIQFLSGFMEANFMPEIPPDPIYCQINLQLRNTNSEESAHGLNIPQAKVFIDSTNQLLGEISLSTDWDGYMEPGEQDTVQLTKVVLEEAPFDPPCNAFVYLEIEVTDNVDQSKFFATDSLLFYCTY